MLDLSSALLPGAAVFAVLLGIEHATGGTLSSRIKVPIAFVLALVLVIVVAHSDFGATQVVAKIALSKMNGASQVLVAIFVGSTAVLGDQVLRKAIPNIGQNQPGNPDGV